MKKLAIVLICLGLVITFTSQVMAKNEKKAECTAIQDGTLTYSSGHYLEGMPFMTGFDAYGYNYQAHMFKGSYANAYLGRDGFPPYLGDDESYLEENPDAAGKWYWPYRSTKLTMKWNDAWLSNMDCDGEGSLDRYFGFDSYIGSGAWITNHQWDSYELDGDQCKWVYFLKIVAVPEDAELTEGIWYTADGSEIGPEIWGSFATIQSIYNDPCSGAYGVEYLSPAGPGLGKYKP